MGQLIMLGSLFAIIAVIVAVVVRSDPEARGDAGERDR